MTHSAAPVGVGPIACPFVALEDDRDSRSGRPDPRNRCYADPVPAPRTIDHQQRFCLSPNFAACPVFAQWAIQAAAQPLPGTEASPGIAALADPAPELWVERIDKTLTPGQERWPDSMDPAIPEAAAVAAAESAEPDSQQLAAFEPPAEEPAGMATPIVPVAVTDEPTLGSSSMLAAPKSAEDEADRGFDPAPLPTFLTTRSPRARAGGGTQPVDGPSASPTWESDPRRAAQGRAQKDGDGAFGRLLTLAAVVIILALGVAAVLIVPGLLSGTPGHTNRPSLVAAPSGPASALASGVAVVPTGSADLSVAPATVTPVPEATPTPTPRSYKVKEGDTLRRIARDFGVTVEQILAANPQIPDADHVEVGQRLVISSP